MLNSVITTYFKIKCIITKHKLKKLYTSYISKFLKISNNFPNDELGGPLLMSPNVKYLKQKTKLLIIGQETNGWGTHPDRIEDGMKLYEQFNLGEKYYSSPFWNVTRKIEKLLGNEPYSCAWTNISKYDVYAKRPKGVHLNEISKIDELLIKEIRILKPDVVIFFTGPRIDNQIERVFDSVSFKSIPNFTIKQLSLLSHPFLPDKTFRAYHPKGLRMHKIEDSFLNYLSNQL